MIFPIVAIIDEGDIDLTVTATTQVGWDQESGTLTVEVSGYLAIITSALKHMRIIYYHQF